MEYREFSAKNLDDAITEACETLMVTSDRLDYEVISKGSSGFLFLYKIDLFYSDVERWSNWKPNVKFYPLGYWI